MNTTLRVEFHCHTVYSKDSLVQPREIVAAAREKGIDRLIITDHNDIRGALLAKELDPERVIVGEEILTTAGELLAFFVREALPAGLAPLEAITRLRQQGAFISVSHPLDAHRGWERSALLSILPLVDALETFNARCLFSHYNYAAQTLAKQHNLPGTVGSDAHTLRELGRATLRLPAFDTAEDLRQALPLGKAQTRLSSPLIHLTSRYAVTLKKLGLAHQP
jgi:predicted metal-dependent phosphoesterase TrpH